MDYRTKKENIVKLFILDLLVWATITLVGVVFLFWFWSFHLFIFMLLKWLPGDVGGHLLEAVSSWTSTTNQICFILFWFQILAKNTRQISISKEVDTANWIHTMSPYFYILEPEHVWLELKTNLKKNNNGSLYLFLLWTSSSKGGYPNWGSWTGMASLLIF